MSYESVCLSLPVPQCQVTLMTRYIWESLHYIFALAKASIPLAGFHFQGFPITYPQLVPIRRHLVNQQTYLFVCRRHSGKCIDRAKLLRFWEEIHVTGKFVTNWVKHMTPLWSGLGCIIQTVLRLQLFSWSWWPFGTPSPVILLSWNFLSFFVVH
jgi:hypothetical protein